MAPLAACSFFENEPPDEPPQADPVREVVASEELILSLTPQLRQLSHSLFNLKLPDWKGRRLFADRVEIVDLDGGQPPTLDRVFPSIAARSRTWPVSTPPEQRDLTALDLWRPLLEQVDYFEHAKFYFVRGSVDDVDRHRRQFRGARRDGPLALGQDGAF